MKEPIPTPPYVHQHYPKWMYHATEPARLVQNAADHDALGDEWAEEPQAAPPSAENKPLSTDDALAIAKADLADLHALVANLEAENADLRKQLSGDGKDAAPEKKPRAPRGKKTTSETGSE